MSTQFLLDEDDIKELAKLMLVMMETQESRKQLCRELGINPQEISFISGTSDDIFCTELIDRLNQYGYKQDLCKLCCQKIFPILNKSVYNHRISNLKNIIEKLNCNCNQEHSPTPSPVPEVGINPPLQPDGAKSQSKKLYWLTGGAIFLMGLAGFQIYNMESVNPRYKGLESLLSERKWEDADRKTADIMWDLAGKSQERSLKTEDYKKLSCDDLRDIDHLWTKYSNQHFGFSIQGRIWQSSDVNNDLGNFINHVGWGRVEENKEKGQVVFVFYPVTNFSLSAPSGTLPWYVNWFGSGDRQAYISRIIDCGI